MPTHPVRVLERKREILAAASRVFRVKGVRGTGMRDVAAALGMTVGSLYYYFRNKQELLAFCQEDGLAGLSELAAFTARLALPADARLYLLVVGHVERLNETTPGSVAHLEIEGLEGEYRAQILARRAAYEAALRALIEEGQAAGVFRPGDAKIAARAILGALNWTVKWFRPEGEKSAREIGAEFAQILVSGLLAPGRTLTLPDLMALPRPEEIPMEKRRWQTA
ncbi:MAG TPA: TetR/AcrR family transcriptional regulator [Thermoanaerobaculia bacterium]|nr:TetR/AcrR family transcriptional regulator [Thermoanaerobaculia bacterium]